MNYLKFKKADGSVDLLPADELLHISAPVATSGDINITLGNSKYKYAVLAGDNEAGTATPLTAASRDGINAAIEKFAFNPNVAVIEVDLGEGLFAESIIITDTPAT
jgi:hypothetical protein|tara:strand:- start:356 stop:673 length:318 start_codon:yes stop_codon:yes gene_type:complete